MKIFNAAQTKQWDNVTLERQGILSLDLMERAAKACFDFITNRFEGRNFYIFCGPGNNGGDGFELARLLIEASFPTKIYSVWRETDSRSADNTVTFNRLTSSGAFVDSFPSSSPIELSDKYVIIDAILGNGQNRPVAGVYKMAVDWINQQNQPVVSIDIPTGLYTRERSPDDSMVFADYTLTFESPKLAMLLPEFEEVVGNWECISIGLDRSFEQEAPSEFVWVTEEEIASDTIPRKRFSHKGTFGKAALFVGSYGMTGAAILSAGAALRSGVGKLFVHTPGKCVDLVQMAVPEAIVRPDPNQLLMSHLPDDLTGFSAVGIGPGIGKETETRELLNQLLDAAIPNLVLDADALNIIAEEGWLERIPEGAVLTPHLMEATRMWGFHTSHYTRLMRIRDFVIRRNLIVVLKGAFTATLSPDGTIYFNSTGNVGLAKAGTGDVLTGMLTSLMAQGYSPLAAAKRAVFIHGQTADDLAKTRHFYSFLASDLVAELGKGKI